MIGQSLFKLNVKPGLVVVRSCTFDMGHPFAMEHAKDRAIINTYVPVRKLEPHLVSLYLRD